MGREQRPFIQQRQRDKTRPAASLVSWWASRSAAITQGDRNRQDVQWEKLCILSLASFSFSFLSSFLFLFLPLPFFRFSCSSGGPRTANFQPRVLGLQGSPPYSNSQVSYSYYTCYAHWGVHVLLQSTLMVQGQFTRVGSLFPACGRNSGIKFRVSCLGDKPLSPLTHTDVIFLSLFFTFTTQVDFHQ